MRINRDIFKAYDIRGLYPSEIDETVVRQIGRGFVAYLDARRIAVSRDMRVSSPQLAAAFIEGALEQGADVVDYGMLSTDALYYAVANDGLDAAVGALAGELAEKAPLALRTLKMVLNRGADAPLDTALELERKSYAWLRATHDYEEGVRSFLDKRPPRYQGR